MAALQTWVPGADAHSDFSLANIPFGIVSTPHDAAPHAATAIGDYVLDLKVLSQQPGFATVFPSLATDNHDVFAQPSLNAFAALDRSVRQAVRATLQDLLSATTQHPGFLKDNEALRTAALLPAAAVRMHLPMVIGDYTDFYAGYHHAFGVGAMWRGPANALQPNYLHLPVGYHGRASSIVVSGTPITRPVGQLVLDPAAEPKQPVVGPSRKLDIELELGCFVAQGNALGTSIPVREAADHIFGYVLVNDWSARDIQNWEYVPLGPFNGKNFGTTISAWVVVPEALAPFKSASIELDARPPLPKYLQEPSTAPVFDIACEVDLTSACSLLILPDPRPYPALPLLCANRGINDMRRARTQPPRATRRRSRASRPRTSSGRFRRCWRTTRWAAVRCAPATCSRRAPSAGPRRPSTAACWR